MHVGALGLSGYDRENCREAKDSLATQRQRMVICGQSPSERPSTYMRRIEKVKFGVPVSEAFGHGVIPATLLILLLKLNKEGAYKRDIFRAPGHQGQVRKLIHVMQHGRLVNIANISAHTAASVIKKFLSKLPGGILGRDNEQLLFNSAEIPDEVKQRESVQRVISSLPVPSQHFLVLLFGTFKLISEPDARQTRMNAEAVGVSVAPSLFHTCVLGQRAAMEDLVRFRLASKILTFIVNNFGAVAMLPRDNYEFYARITGRTLQISDDGWCIFYYPPEFGYPPAPLGPPGIGPGATPHSTVVPPSGGGSARGSAGGIGSNGDRVRALSQPEVVITSDIPESAESSAALSLDDYKKKPARSNDITKSLSHLGDVHERQTKRMQTRSEWFLSPLPLRVSSGINRSLETAFPAQAALARKESGGGANGNGGGVSRRRSWRRHYQRPRSAASENVEDYDYAQLSYGGTFDSGPRSFDVAVLPAPSVQPPARGVTSCISATITSSTATRDSAYADVRSENPQGPPGAVPYCFSTSGSPVTAKPATSKPALVSQGRLMSSGHIASSAAILPRTTDSSLTGSAGPGRGVPQHADGARGEPQHKSILQKMDVAVKKHRGAGTAISARGEPSAQLDPKLSETMQPIVVMISDDGDIEELNVGAPGLRPSGSSTGGSDLMVTSPSPGGLSGDSSSMMPSPSPTDPAAASPRHTARFPAIDPASRTVHVTASPMYHNVVFLGAGTSVAGGQVGGDPKTGVLGGVGGTFASASLARRSPLSIDTSTYSDYEPTTSGMSSSCERSPRCYYPSEQDVSGESAGRPSLPSSPLPPPAPTPEIVVIAGSVSGGLEKSGVDKDVLEQAGGGTRGSSRQGMEISNPPSAYQSDGCDE